MSEVAEVARPARKVTTLAELTPSQIEAIRKIPAEKDAVVVPLGATRPNAIFTGRERFDLEQARIFRRYPGPGDAVGAAAGARHGHGPRQLRRAADDRAHQARGDEGLPQRLPAQGFEASGGLRGPQAWTRHLPVSRLDLRHRRQADRRCPERGLPEDLDKSQRGLVELPAREWGGVSMSSWMVIQSRTGRS
jgi:hypothetical protein